MFNDDNPDFWPVRNARNGTNIVFVHGFWSSASSAWFNPNSETFWPDLVCKDPKLSGFGVCLFQYPAGFFTKTFNLVDAADRLKVELEKLPTHDKDIVFVCHSMGGIVVRKMLVNHETEFFSRFDRVGLFLVASPSLGSVWANILTYIPGVSSAFFRGMAIGGDAITELLKNFKRLLERLNTEYLLVSKQKRIIGREISERYQTFGLRIVPRGSAEVHFSDVLPIAENHITICRPNGLGHKTHTELVDFVRGIGKSVGELEGSSLMLLPVDQRRSKVTSVIGLLLTACTVGLAVWLGKQWLPPGPTPCPEISGEYSAASVTRDAATAKFNTLEVFNNLTINQSACGIDGNFWNSTKSVSHTFKGIFDGGMFTIAMTRMVVQGGCVTVYRGNISKVTDNQLTMSLLETDGRCGIPKYLDLDTGNFVIGRRISWHR